MFLTPLHPYQPTTSHLLHTISTYYLLDPKVYPQRAQVNKQALSSSARKRMGTSNQSNSLQHPSVPSNKHKPLHFAWVTTSKIQWVGVEHRFLSSGVMGDNNLDFNPPCDYYFLVCTSYTSVELSASFFHSE